MTGLVLTAALLILQLILDKTLDMVLELKMMLFVINDE